MFIDCNNKVRPKIKQQETAKLETGELKNIAMACACALFDKSYPDKSKKYVNTLELDMAKVKEFYKQFSVTFDGCDINAEGICKVYYTALRPGKETK